MSSADDESRLSDSGGGGVKSLLRELVGNSVSDEVLNSISEQFSSLQQSASKHSASKEQSDQGLDLYSNLPPVGDPSRKEKLLDMLFADIAIRRHLGTELSIHQYLRRYPELQREEVLSAFDAVGGQKSAGGGASNIHESLPALTASSALKTMGEYKLVKQLGQGGFGEVWLAEAPGGVPAAVKIIKRPIDDYTARQEHQALLLVKGLSHPFLVQTQAYWILDDRLVIAMEVCEQNLRQRLKQCQAEGLKGVPKKELLHCFRQAAEALDYLHKHRVHHRDIKPENMLLHHGHVKVADFGLAFMYDGEASMMTAPEAGTGRYMAPEVWNRKLSKHSDQYSLALAYAELRLGRPIITGKGTVEFMRQHINQEPNLDGLAMDEADAVRQALAKSPHDRFESCIAFIEALEATEKKETQKKNRWLVPTLSVAFAAVTVGLVWSQWFGGGGSTTAQVAIQPWLPSGFEVGQGRVIVTDGSERPWHHLIQKKAGKTTVNFVFVEPTVGGVQPFYISQTKITNGMVKAAYADADFQKRLEKWKAKVGPELAPKCFPQGWSKGGIRKTSDNKAEDVGSDDDEHPALRITAAEAAVVAEWLGGELPTVQQWDAVAGLDGDEFTPFMLPKGEVSRFSENGPMRVGTKIKDVSHGVWDVAGNGTEWTRKFTEQADLSIHDERLGKMLEERRIKKDANIPLRGFSYADTRAVASMQSVLKTKSGFGRVSWTSADPNIGFRVVVEPR
jgi:formylglycine-generating enzyme required for sulfatase activity